MFTECAILLAESDLCRLKSSYLVVGIITSGKLIHRVNMIIHIGMIIIISFTFTPCYRHDGPVWQLAWAHPMYGNMIASCGYDRKVIIWKETNGTWGKLYEYSNHDSSGRLFCLKFGYHISGLFSFSKRDMFKRVIMCLQDLHFKFTHVNLKCKSCSVNPTGA